MPHAFESLTPDVVLDALDSVGLRGDGRLTALSSYENRVYQVQLEDGSAVVAKFYRPGRWSDEQIQEEHDFAAELMAAEIPPSGHWWLQGRHAARLWRLCLQRQPRRGGRPPELDDGEVLEWIGRFLARIHTVGAKKPFASRPAGPAELWRGVHAVAAGARQGAAGRAIALGEGVHKRY
jgi:Ser/Thr protein kinase RdoA (MazF antagonist)